MPSASSLLNILVEAISARSDMFAMVMIAIVCLNAFDPPGSNSTVTKIISGPFLRTESFGDWPELRNNPALKNVNLPDELGIAGPQGGIVTKGGLFFVGGEDMSLHAIDKTNGKDLWKGTLPARSYGTPMTYRTRTGRQVVVIAVGQGSDAALVAFALP